MNFKEFQQTSDYAAACSAKSKEIRENCGDDECFVGDCQVGLTEGDWSIFANLIEDISSESTNMCSVEYAWALIRGMAKQHSLQIEHEVEVDFDEKQLQDNAA